MTNLRFREDGSFRVLQMADIQDGPNVLPDTIRLIREAIRKADPDLVVFTGDQIRGYDPAYIDTFLRRRGEEPGARVRAVTEVEAKLRGIKRRARNRVNNRLLAMKSPPRPRWSTPQHPIHRMCRRLWTSSWTRPVTKSAARLPASLARSSKRKCRSPHLRQSRFPVRHPGRRAGRHLPRIPRLPEPGRQPRARHFCPAH